MKSLPTGYSASLAWIASGCLAQTVCKNRRHSGMREAQTRNLEIPGSMRSLSSGRASRGPVGIDPE
jgi:hypothetical protein